MENYPTISFKYIDEIYEVTGYSESDDIYVRIASGLIFYEIDVLEKIKKLKVKGVYIDIGANIGNHSIFFLNECNSSMLISIEANENLIPILNNNMSKNNHQNKKYLVFNSIISTYKNVFFHITDNINNIGKSYFTVNQDIERKSELKMAISLDNLLTNIVDLEKIGFIKIDVEGQELDVLESSRQTIIKYRPYICIEIFPEKFLNTLNYLNQIQYELLYKLPGSNYIFSYKFSPRFIFSYNSLRIKRLITRVARKLETIFIV